jgi:hypothetical protein
VALYLNLLLSLLPRSLKIWAGTEILSKELRSRTFYQILIIVMTKPLYQLKVAVYYGW